MRTRKAFKIGVACLAAVVTVLAGAVPADAAAAPVTTFISVLTEQGNRPNNSNRMVLDVLDGKPENGVPLQLWRQNGLPQQTWNIFRTTEYYNGYPIYEFKNNHTNKCMDMAVDGPVGDGTRVQQWGCSYGSNQKWIAVSLGGTNAPWVELQSRRNPSLCLDVTGYNYSNGARLQVFTCHGGWNQRFNIS